MSEDQRIEGRGPAPRALRVVAPARLHIGFLDLNGGLGRRFSSLGLALESPSTQILLETADALSASGPDADRAKAALEKIAGVHGSIDPRIRIVVEKALTAHAGLGSGTQLSLAVGVAASALSGHPLAASEIARALGRGMRSSIGLGAFEGGGVLLDGGQPIARRPGDHRPPPLLSRVPIPDRWRILLIFDRDRTGLSGADESQAMQGLPEFPERLADRLCRLALVGAMPAAADGDADAFGRAVGEIQRRLGDHFARHQGGRFTSPDVADALKLIEDDGVPGVGQSSWGPTGFAVFGDAVAAEDAAADLGARFSSRKNLVFDVVRGANRGASITDAIHSSAGSA